MTDTSRADAQSASADALADARDALAAASNAYDDAFAARAALAALAARFTSDLAAHDDVLAVRAALAARATSDLAAHDDVLAALAAALISARAAHDATLDVFHNPTQQPEERRMNAQMIPDYDAAELYIAIATHPHGEQIAIHQDGSISYHDSTLLIAWEDGREPIAIIRAEGDFDRSGWGITRDDDAGCWRVDTLDGSWDDSDDALRAAVEAFGIQADLIDSLDETILAAFN